MTAKKSPTTILAYDHEDRAAREFRPCSTCRYKYMTEDRSRTGCRMFGYIDTGNAREKFCGKFGDAWRAKEPDDFAAVPMVERVLG